ncbi:hypothetical protein KG089_05150 [Carnobacteriaceae bacterium zg-ZUI252]|nr:hypothetical protein [Carnobacteriaceae bacterium zg-ZUI252]
MEITGIATLLGAIAGLLKVVFDYRVSSNKTNAVLETIQTDLVSIKSDTEKTREVSLANREAIKETQRYHLQKDIIKAVERGYTTMYEVEKIKELYQSYCNLDGNGVIETLFEKFKALTVKKEN